MVLIELIGGILVVLGGVAAGTVVHELSHALTLRASGVRCEITWLRGESGGVLEAGLFGALATVQPRELPSNLAPWRLRAASLMPLSMAAPLLLIPLGVLPDPFAVDHPYPKLALVGWLACAIPSHQDFAMFWHAECVIEGDH